MARRYGLDRVPSSLGCPRAHQSIDRSWYRWRAVISTSVRLQYFQSSLAARKYLEPDLVDVERVQVAGMTATYCSGLVREEPGTGRLW